ncbi:MAG TPA: hypothetical protein VG649_08550 [Candidatus Angelobacter sp.]|nr:hypothetical protein [Candidatus Angelobacter sp.]
MLQSMTGFVLAAALLCPVCFTQTANPKKPAAKTTNAQTALADQKERSFWALVDLIQISKGFQDDVFRIKTQAQIADMLWDYDKLRARRFFLEALNSIDAISNESHQKNSIQQRKSQLRSQLLRILSRHDPAMAEELLKSFLKSEEKDQANDPSLYPGLAVDMAGIDLRRAIAMARAGLTAGVTPELIDSLHKIRVVAPAEADNLFNQSLAVAAKDQESFGRSLGFLAHYIFGPQMNGSTVPGNNPNAEGALQDAANEDGASTQPTIALPDAGLAINFLQFAFQTMLANASPDQASTQYKPGLPNYLPLVQLLPYFRQYLPDDAAIITSGIEQAVATIPDAAKRALLTNLTAEAPPKGIVQAADSLAKVEERDLLYQRAALRAAGQGDFEQALSISSSIHNDQLRQSIESGVRSRAATLALNRGDIRTAYENAAALSNPQQQATMFSHIIRALLKKKDTVQAAEIVNSAEMIIAKAENTIQKARALLILAETAAELDETRSLIILQLAVQAFNQSDRVTNHKETPLTPVSQIASSMQESTWAASLSDFKSFSILGHTHFDGALSLARSIRKQETSVIAQMAVCQGSLAEQIQPQKKGK